MELPLSRPLVPRLIVLDECTSTNSELVERAATGREPDFSTLVTANQTHGRGRLGRTWVAPPGRTLAVSVFVRPILQDGEPLGLEHYGWLSLLAGVAMTRAVAGILGVDAEPVEVSPEPVEAFPEPVEVFPEPVGAFPEPVEVFPEPVEGPPPVTLKWPNDVLIDGRKGAGLLAELLPDGRGVVLGAGLNLSIPARELPTPAATSLTLHGAAPEQLFDVALSGYLRHLRSLYGQFLRGGGGSIRTQVSAVCSTLGKQVRVELPGGDELRGTAVDLDDFGRLRINTTTDAALVAVAAGDVTHVR